MQIIPAEKGWSVLINCHYMLPSLLEDEGETIFDLFTRIDRWADPVIAWGIDDYGNIEVAVTGRGPLKVDLYTLFCTPHCKYSSEYLELDASSTLEEVSSWCEAHISKAQDS